MAITVSVGSGKGGTGKSVVLSNLALQLARAGRRVCIADLDLGGADAHILYGLFAPERTLTDFLARRVETLEEVMCDFPSLGGVRLIPGTGDTLQSANMTYQEKQRLLRSLAMIDIDVLLIDVGAGTSYHALDFFMCTDIQLCITSPEPTSIMDFYNFLQLATIRRALSAFLSHTEVSMAIRDRKFTSLAEVFDLAESIQPGARKRAQEALATFNPLLIVNKVGTGTKLNMMKLRKLASTYLGIYLPDIGEIPYDEKVYESLRSFLPVTELAPDSPASIALKESSVKLGKVIDLFLRKRAQQQTTTV